MELTTRKLPGVVTSVSNSLYENIQRASVAFSNGYTLSIIRGQYSHGGSEGLYEIAIINPNNEMDGSLFDEEDQGDDVLGWCTEDKVMHYINKIAKEIV